MSAPAAPAAPVAEFTYAHAKSLIRDALDADAYWSTRKVTISPGPASDAILQKASPQEIVFLNVGGGAGFTKEQTFDRVFIGLYVLGRQGSYDSAEGLALFVDRTLCGVDSSRSIGDAYTLSITRTGGRPALLVRDSADRYHFTGSYIAEAATGR